MRKFFAACISFLCIVSIARAQTEIKGKIVDTLEKSTPANAVVSLLKKDSTLINFTRTNKDGSFSLLKVAPGSYKLLISYPRFADYADEVEVKNDGVIDLGKIALTQKATLLKEVVVRSGQAIRIKGDTTEFTADSFAVRDGATVEELLQKLPGFQVNSKGEITAQGQRVQKVLVDGEEFFGDDPTMATQNISAKAVDKVQVFDTKTDQQQLTGIGSGSDGKTVNIKLKENSKKGAFGRFHAASDFDRYFDSKALYNNFVGKKKISVYGSKTNLNTGSLNWEDRQKLGIENDVEYDEINGYYYSIGNSDEFNDWSLRGLPDAYTAGGLYTNKWNADKHNVNLSYRYNRLGTRNESSHLSQTILDSGLLYSNRFVKTNGLNTQHAANAKYEWKIDSLASVKFVTAALHKTTDAFNRADNVSFNEDRDTLNLSEQTRNTNTERKQLDNQLTYKQLFNKKNRQLLVNLRFGITDDIQNGHLFATTNFYKDGQLDSVGITDQLKNGSGFSQTLGSKLTFSEPLNVNWNVVLDYSFNNNNSSSNLGSYNESFNGKYETLDSAYSNNFDLNAASHSGTGTLRYVSRKMNFAFGSGLSSVNLKLHDLEKNNRSAYHFVNLTPQAQFRYTIKTQTNFDISYRGSTRQPSIDQLQPIRDNTDPLNIFMGNPDLKVGFTHTFRTGYNSYKLLSARYFYVNASYNFTNNAITRSNIIDKQTGARVTKPININGNNNWNVSAYWMRGEGDKKFNHSLQTYVNGGRNINLINGSKGINDYSNFTLYYGIRYSVDQKYRFSLNPQIGYSKSKSSLQTRINNNYLSYGGRADAYVMLPGKVEIGTDVNADLRQRIAAFDQNTNIIQWNGNISRKVFKDKSGKIIFVANDILNQNKGYSRTINSNFISDDRYLRVSRYFLLKFEWTFNKMPVGK